MQGNDSVAYISGSYTVIGQDGKHNNLAIIDPPTNTSVPAQVLSDLYYMSEHLPVALQLSITKSIIAGVADHTGHELHLEYNHIVKDCLHLKLTNDNKDGVSHCEVLIYNMQGAAFRFTGICRKPGQY